MKRHTEFFVSAAIMVFVLYGCTPSRYIWQSDPEVQSASNEYFDAQIAPIWHPYGAKSFLLTINNKTEKPIELNWNKTIYISGGQSSGGFMYEGIIFAQRNEPKQNDVVFPKTVFKKEIWPNILVKYSTDPYTVQGWVHWNMTEGVNGIYLNTVVDGKDISEKLTVNLRRIK